MYFGLGFLLVFIGHYILFMILRFSIRTRVVAERKQKRVDEIEMKYSEICPPLNILDINEVPWPL